jgi:hypothetical protein
VILTLYGDPLTLAGRVLVLYPAGPAPDEARRSGGWLPVVYVDQDGNPIDLDAKVEAAIEAAPPEEAEQAREIRSEIDLTDTARIIAQGMQDEARLLAALINRIDAALAEEIRAQIEAAEMDDAALALLLLA